jgi:anti-sigma factor RsiW
MQSARSSHLATARLERFLRGELPREEARAVVRHLLTDCPQCVARTRQLSPPGDPLLGLEALIREMVEEAAGGELLYEEPSSS